MNAVYDAAQYADGTDPPIYLDPLPSRRSARPACDVARKCSDARRDCSTAFPDCALAWRQRLQTGIRTPRIGGENLQRCEPLTARVIVNRVWDWHFGRPLVATPSDFGVQGDKPTHPELLDDLAARFIAHGWSLKWLNREVMLSAAYRQDSRPRADAEKADPANALLWRMNPRRLDVESYRDSMLREAGALDDTMYGTPEDTDKDTSVRRTVYGKVSRMRLSNLLTGAAIFPIRRRPARAAISPLLPYSNFSS